MKSYQTIEQKGVSIYLMETIKFDAENQHLHLLESEKKRHESIRNQHKKNEFSTTRKLKYLLFGNLEIIYRQDGSPFIKEIDSYLSISHSNDYVGIAVSRDRLGFDLELISDKATRVAKKFCNTTESLIFDIDSPFEMSLLWSFKESLYKISDIRGLSFLTDIFIEKQKHEFIGNIRCKGGIEKFLLHFEVHNMLIVTFTTHAI